MRVRCDETRPKFSAARILEGEEERKWNVRVW
jgi:hypothetical protein